jgi:hypothetical protein
LDHTAAQPEFDVRGEKVQALEQLFVDMESDPLASCQKVLLLNREAPENETEHSEVSAVYLQGVMAIGFADFFRLVDFGCTGFVVEATANLDKQCELIALGAMPRDLPHDAHDEFEAHMREFLRDIKLPSQAADRIPLPPQADSKLGDPRFSKRNARNKLPTLVRRGQRHR